MSGRLLNRHALLTGAGGGIGLAVAEAFAREGARCTVADLPAEPSAAFLAASEHASTIELRHVIAATRSELFKLGMNSAEQELAELEAANRAAGWRVA